MSKHNMICAFCGDRFHYGEYCCGFYSELAHGCCSVFCLEKYVEAMKGTTELVDFLVSAINQDNISDFCVKEAIKENIDEVGRRLVVAILKDNGVEVDDL